MAILVITYQNPEYMNPEKQLVGVSYDTDTANLLAYKYAHDNSIPIDYMFIERFIGDNLISENRDRVNVIYKNWKHSPYKVLSYPDWC